MYEMVQERIIAKYPDVFNEECFRQGEKGRQLRELLDEKVAESFDSLLSELLQKRAFMEHYFLVLRDVLNTRDLSSALERICESDHGALIFGDAAYLKIANTVSREYGDKMLMAIARAIVRAAFGLCARFREGDEFICFAETETLAHGGCKQVLAMLGDDEKIFNLDLRVDFGVATHAEVARTYLTLIDRNLVPRGRSPEQVFFDTALSIAETRSNIEKIRERALLLTTLLRAKHAGEMDVVEYKESLSMLTRGGKFVIPDVRWLDVDTAKLRDFTLLKTLAFLGKSAPDSEYDRVMLDVAESVYFDPSCI